MVTTAPPPRHRKSRFCGVRLPMTAHTAGLPRSCREPHPPTRHPARTDRSAGRTRQHPPRTPPVPQFPGTGVRAETPACTPRIKGTKIRNRCARREAWPCSRRGPCICRTARQATSTLAELRRPPAGTEQACRNRHADSRETAGSWPGRRTRCAGASPAEEGQWDGTEQDENGPEPPYDKRCSAFRRAQRATRPGQDGPSGPPCLRLPFLRYWGSANRNVQFAFCSPALFTKEFVPHGQSSCRNPV